MTLTLNEKEQLARKFLSVLGHPDAAVVESVAIAAVVWSFPGSSPISGEAHGVEGIMKRATIIASYGVKVEVLRPVFGFSGVAVLLHNTGSKSGLDLDEYLAAVFTFHGDKISRLDTYLSDVPMMERFFA